MEAPGSFYPERLDPIPEPVTLPEPKTLGDLVSAPCKHECSILKQICHAKQAHGLLSTLNSTKQALLKATAGQCSLDSAHSHSARVQEVANLDRPGGEDGGPAKPPFSALLPYTDSDCQWTTPD